MTRLTLLLLLFFAASACSQNEPPRPDARIPDELTKEEELPRLHGTENRHLWSWAAQMVAIHGRDQSRKAAIRCIEDARQAIIDGEDVPDCG